MKRSEASSRRIKWWVFGFLMQTFLVLCIIHELGHAAAAILSGARVLRFGWTSIQTTFHTPLILAAGYLTELVVYGWVMIVSTRRWSRLGFFAAGAFSGAAMWWWFSYDRIMMAADFGGGSTLVWDVLVVLLIILGYSTRRHRVWVENTHLMALVTGREAPWHKERKHSNRPVLTALEKGSTSTSGRTTYSTR